MKRQLCCLLLIIFIFVSLTACSGGAVQYTEKLGNNKNCYIDVTEIQPYLDDGLHVYCKCILSDGSEAWMHIYDFDYIAYFDSTADEDDYSQILKGVKYDSPVRLNGKVAKIEDAINGGDKKIKVFDFSDANSEDTLNSTEMFYCGEKYNTSLNPDTYVYADITKISHYSSVSTQTNYVGTFLSDMICECTLENGDIIFVMISMSDYKEYFDPSVSPSLDKAKDIAFTAPIRIYGMAIDPKEDFSSNDEIYGEDLLFEFRGGSKDDINNAKGK